MFAISKVPVKIPFWGIFSVLSLLVEVTLSMTVSSLIDSDAVELTGVVKKPMFKKITSFTHRGYCDFNPLNCRMA